MDVDKSTWAKAKKPIGEISVVALVSVAQYDALETLANDTGCGSISDLVRYLADYYNESGMGLSIESDGEGAATFNWFVLERKNPEEAFRLKEELEGR